MPYVVFIKAPNLDYLRYIQHNDKQRMSKMKTVEFFFLILCLIKKLFDVFFRKVVWVIIRY
jgi:hypothetical protein